MAKQLNVSLGFTADTSQAKAQLQDLQNQLSKLALTTGTGPKLGFTKELQEATTAAAQLQVQLKNATNVNTGTLDLGKFAESMNKSGMSLTKYQQQLRNLGPEGDKAFAQLAQSITNAEIPLKRASSLTTELWTTLKNTARWQLSSSLLHGFMGTLQSAYGYAQDLNESLNNIRIVTGASVEEMDKFAEKANKAARALSTTTTEYTNAALIFYQQGLGDDEVEARTNTTIKMAHAAGESAEEVSSYMTAIWNNFAQGSDNLEYYGDVMAELGAKTAASSAEIAEGLGKFAAIGEVVGLEYEYATSAVATLVDKTREAPETVGTALKTIFARLQGLSMGETLEDGVNLNKYSKALQAVGIQVLDVNGGMKDATSIIDELGAKWEDLNSAQKTALAQTVAGTRQYTYFMSMFENFDAFKENVEAAYSSTGTLEEQASIYAESWEAARDRVTASAESIYGALLDDEFFIDLNNFFADFLGVIDDTIDGLGGLKGVLLTLGTIVTQVFKKQIAESLGNIAYNIKMSTQAGRESLVQMKRDANAKLVKENFDQDTTSSRAAGLAYQAQGNAQMEYINNAERMSAEEQQISQHLLDRVRLMGQLVAKSGEELEKAEELSSELIRQAELKKKGLIDTNVKNTAKTSGKQLGNLTQVDNIMASTMDAVTASKTGAKGQESALKSLRESLLAIKKGYEDIGISIDEAFGDTGAVQAFDAILDSINADGTVTDEKLDALKQGWNDWNTAIMQSGANFETAFDALIKDADLTETQIENLRQSLLNVGNAQGQLAAQSGKLAAMGEGVKKFFMGAKGEAMSMSTALTQSASAVMSFGMTVSAITGLIDTWKDSEASLTDKLLASTTTIGMLVPSVMSVIKGFQGAGQAVTIFGVQTSLAMWQVTLIVAAIAALVAIFAVLIKSAQDKSLEHQLKKSQQAASDLKDNLEQVKQEAEDIKSTFDEYDSLVDTLNDCVKGTDEWKAALEDVNDCVLDLLDKYPQLAQYQDLYTRNADGMLELNQEVMDSVLKDMETMVDAATAASLLASADVAQDKAAIKSRDLNNEVGSYGAGDITYVDDMGNIYYESYVKMGEILTENAEDLANLTEEEYGEKIRELAEQAAAGTEMTTAQFEAMVADLMNYQDEVDALATATRNAANQMDNATMALANQVLSAQGYDAAETTMAAAGLGDEYESIYDEIIELSHKNAKGDSNTDYSDEIWERFEAATGKTYDQVKNTIQGNDDNRVYAYKDDSGKEQTFSEEYMAKTIAAYEAMQKLTDNAEAASDALSNMEDKVSNAEVSQGIKDWIAGGSFENMTESDFNTMKSDIDSAGGTDAYLQEIFGMSAEELAATFGEDYVAQFEESMTGFSDELADVGGDLLTPVKEVFDAMDTSNLTLAGQKAVADAMQAAFVNGGAEGLAMVTSAMDGMEADEAQAFANTLNSMDWDNVDASTLAKTLKQAGIETDFTTEQLKELIDVMSDPRAIKDFDSLAEGFASIHEVADGLEFGDSISAEDFAVLGDEFESYFTRMADGTYKLTGDAEEFYEAVQAKSIEGFVENVDKLREQNAKLQAIKNFDFEDLSQSQLNAETNTYSGTDTKRQIQALEAVGYDAEQIAKWNEDLADGSTSVETLQAIADAVADYKTQLEQLDYEIAANEQAIFNQEVAIATSYASLKDLKQAYEEGTISAEAFSVAAMQLHEAESMDGLDTEEMNDYADHLMEIAESSDMVSDELADNEEAAEDVAKATMKLNRGIDKLADGFEDWSDVIENSDESSQEFAEAMSGMKDAMSDILGTSEDFISNDFIVEHLEEIEKAATGDEEAIRSLQRALSDDILCTVMGVSDFTQLDADLQNLQNEVWTLSNQDIEVGATLDQGEFINSANELIKNAGMTVDEAQAYFNSLGYEPEFVTEEQTVKRSIPQETTHTDYAITPGTLDIMGVEVPIPTVDRITTTRVTGYEELDEVIQVPALSADGTPQIKSLTRTNSGGSLSNYSSGNKGGKSPGSGGGKGGGGGGNKEVKDKKNLTDEKERYHEITNTIEDMQHALDRVSAAKDRAFGKAKIAKINEEIAAYDNLIAAQEQYVREIEDNYKKDKNTLAGYGASFDKNGNVDNYDQLMASQVQRYNDAVAIYNASAQTDADKEAFQAAEDYYEAFLEALNQYEETHDLKKEAQATLEDQINARYDLELEKIDYKVNLQIEFSDDELEHLEYLLERIEEKGFAAAEAIANLGQQTQSVMNKSDAYKEGIFSILGNHGLSDSDINAWLQGDEAATQKVAGLNLTEAEVEKLREYTAGLRDNNEALIEMRQAVHDKMLETFDEWNEKIDRNIDKLDHLKSMTESYRNIVDLVGKANFAGGAETIERLNASTVKQAGNYAQANIANRDRIAEQLQATRDAYAAQKDTISEEERKMWEDTIKEMEDQLNEAEEAAMGSIEEWMEAINQQFLDSVTNTMDKFADAVAGRFANLNELSEAFERQQSVNDRYLESYEKIYEFSKLNRDIEKSIDQTDNIKAKKELADLQAEINALEESGVEVSEYQMENLRKRYELKLAELALEEAQNAKSEVRMTRDNEGNWGYVYTADETQVAEAEQNYEDKLYELQQHNAEYINQLQESIITMQQEMYDKMQEIAQDESLSVEERQAKMQEVQAYYQEQMGYYYSELELVLGNNKVLYEDDWQKYSDMTGYKIAKDEEYVDSFDETAYSVLTGFTTMEDAQAAFNSASETMLDENLTAMETWQTNMENGPLAAMDSSFDTLAQDIDGHLTTIEQESDNTAKEIEDDTKAAVEDYNGVVEAVKAWETQYSASVKIMIDESDNLIAKFNQVLALWADVKAAAEEAEDPPTPDNGGDDGGGGDNGGGGGGGDGKPSWDRVVAAYNKINGGKWGNGLQNRINKGKSDGFTEAEVRAGQQLINYTYPPNLNGYGYSREKAKSLMGYDTGGYTGEWGDTSGRLALLHQKELVLNQEDTANILSAIDMIRQISSLIDLNAMSSMKGLGGMLAAGGVGQTMGGIEQHIEIHASFPDATDHSEIEEAFHNLLNSASQYANRKL